MRWLRSQGADVVGVECGDVMMRMALDADPDHADDYLDGVGQDLPLPDDSADVVVYSYSLHHVPQPDMAAALQEARRVLRDGGLLYVVEPLADGPGHEVVRLIDDETEKRAHAQAALREAPSLGFDVVTETSYVSRMLLADAEALATRIVGVDPERTERMERHRAEFEELFESLATRVDERYAFDQVNLVTVLRASP